MKWSFVSVIFLVRLNRVDLNFKFFNSFIAETMLALLRHPDFCISAYSSVSQLNLYIYIYMILAAIVIMMVK